MKVWGLQLGIQNLAQGLSICRGYEVVRVPLHCWIRAICFRASTKGIDVKSIRRLMSRFHRLSLARAQKNLSCVASTATTRYVELGLWEFHRKPRHC